MGCGNGKAVHPETSVLPQENGPKTARGVPPKKAKDERPGPESRNNGPGDKQVWIVMGKYRMNMCKEDIVGEGTSSICRKATNIQTGELVGVKVYKSHKDVAKHEEVKMQKFRRQIAVLKELQEPFTMPSDPTLWSDQLARAKPSRLFMQLLDYSKDAKGEPAPDPTDGILYVVTELAQYSLKDYLALRRDQSRPLTKDSVRNITKAIILVMAGLHAKGLVHIDLKPENLMMFNGRLKLIDVDGCVKAGTNVSIQDSSISFSPCYCAPEWAKFLIEDSESRIMVSPALDVWSVGMTVCELVTLDAILKPMYANFLRNGHSHREAGFLFMDWLSSIKKAPVPKTVEKFDMEFMDVLVNWLLVCDPAKRMTCAQSLTNPYIATVNNSELKKSTTKSLTTDGDNHLGVSAEEQSQLYNAGNQQKFGQAAQDEQKRPQTKRDEGDANTPLQLQAKKKK